MADENRARIGFGVGTDPLQPIIGRTERKLNRFLKLFSKELALELLKNTPVDTGFLRASWTAVGDNIASGSDVRANSEKVPNQSAIGTPTHIRIWNQIDRLPRNVETVYILNTAPYSEEQEFGSPNRPGKAFMRRSISRAPIIADQIARRLKLDISGE